MPRVDSTAPSSRNHDLCYTLLDTGGQQHGREESQNGHSGGQVDSLNRTLHIGAIAKTPELKYTPTGTPVLTLILGGTDHLKTTQDLGVVELPWYHRFTFLGKPAEALHPQVERHVGQAVLIEGKLDYREWSDPKEPEVKQRKVDVKGTRLEFLDRTEEEFLQEKGVVRLKNGRNQVEVTALVGSEPRHRELPQGGFVSNLNLAVKEVWLKGGVEHNKTHWVQASAWDQLGQFAQESVYKHDLLWVLGRLHCERWEDSSGKKRSENRIEVQDLEVLRRMTGGNTPEEGV